jgi:protein-S-isoprenylcysteine O-methyltransferase Ste14
MANQKEQNNDKQNLTKNIIRRIVTEGLFLVFEILILFFSAGRIDWDYAWIFTIITVLIALIGVAILPPELLSERGRKKENVEKWDSLITRLIILPWLTIYLVSGLDFRFGWSPELALTVHIVATVIYVFGNAFALWSMLANAYFSTAVRIQYDRGHAVCTSGPYRYMRHPGYLGMMTYVLSTPIIFGSIWALIPAGIVVVLLIIRLVLEDRTLKNKLEGYKGYADKVKYRLIPGVW